jgi:hypothetical protein
VVNMAQVYFELGPVQREHLSADNFLALLAKILGRVADRTLGRDPSNSEILGLFHITGLLMRRCARACIAHCMLCFASLLSCVSSTLCPPLSVMGWHQRERTTAA